MADPTFQLTMRSGPNPGEVFSLEQEETFMGRDLANEITISDPEVSRRHARLKWQGDSVFLEDLGSTNGTFLNGQRIASPQQLRIGDVITLGENIVFIFEHLKADSEATVGTVPKVQATPPPPQPEVIPPPRQEVAQVVSYRQPQPVMEAEPLHPVVVEDERRKMPPWLVILIIAIVVLTCVIAITLWYMPTSWWCALSFNLLQGCPVP